MTITPLDLRTPPTDPLAEQVAASTGQAAEMLTDALAEIARSGLACSEAVGHNRPMGAANQARFLMALQQAAASVGTYETLALLEQSQRGGGVVVPLALAAEVDELAAFRLADGTVCWRGVPVEHVIVGEWFQVLADGPWHRVVRAPGSESSVGLSFRLPSGSLTTEWFERGTTLRVACRPELLARRAESAELRAEARADRAEVAG